MTSVRKKDWEALNYVISEKADEIDQLKFGEVCRWVAQEAVYDRSAPTFRYFCEPLISDLIDLVIEDLGPSVLFKNLDEKDLLYVDEFDHQCSIFNYVTFKDDVNIPQKLLKPIAFKNATFNGKVNIDAPNIQKGVFLKSIFKKDVTISDGCKSLGIKCFQSDFINNAKLYIPKSVESIDYQAFSEDTYVKNNIFFGGTVDQFNELTKRADKSMQESIVYIKEWPGYVVCSNGTWTAEYYINSK